MPLRGQAEAEIPAHQMCPDGTKVFVLCVGWLECDDGFLYRGGNTSLKSTENQSFVNKRTKFPLYVCLIDHPKAGLILWETGGDIDWPTQTGPVVNDIFNRCEYQEVHKLDKAIESVGYNIKDVKHIIIGHLHLDHAGGLGFFKGSKIPIWVHELELKSAFFCVATGQDDAVYLKGYLDLDLNWKVVDESVVDFAQGIFLHHFPGHTEGLMGLQINLPKTGTWVFCSDQYHVAKNYEDGITQGWLARDHPSWFRSHNKIKRMAQRFAATVVPGHDTKACQDIWDEFPQGAPLT